MRSPALRAWCYFAIAQQYQALDMPGDQSVMLQRAIHAALDAQQERQKAAAAAEPTNAVSRQEHVAPSPQAAAAAAPGFVGFFGWYWPLLLGAASYVLSNLLKPILERVGTSALNWFADGRRGRRARRR
jgi:hypothetical protein